MRTGLLTSIAAYVLLCVAILMDADPAMIVAATVFYLIGALVGLFSRLRSDAQTDQAVEDYGLNTVRLVFTPLFSGLAAIGGVVLINLLPAVQAQPVPDAAQAQLTGQLLQQATASDALINLSAIFNLRGNQFGLIVAAIFGLTPQLLLDRLLHSADQYKVELQSTEGATRTNALTPEQANALIVNRST